MNEIIRAFLVILFFVVVSFAIFFLKICVKDFNVYRLILCLSFHILGLSLYVYLTRRPVEDFLHN